MVVVFDSCLLATLDQFVQIVTGAVSSDQHEVVDGQIVTGTVTGQQIAVGVQHVAPGGFYPCPGSKGSGIVGFTTGLHHLQIIQSECKKDHHQKE